MIRLSRMTDYGIVVMSQMGQDLDAAKTAQEIALSCGIPAPTASKLLKALARAGLVDSRRGAHGGYALAREPKDITAADIIEALEGPVALTACVEGSDSDCGVESLCPMRGGWDKVNTAIREALEDLTLADLAMPMEFPELPPVPATPAGHGKRADATAS